MLDKISKELKDVAHLHKADILLYTGEINSAGADKLIRITENPSNNAVVLILCTQGGLPGEAYKIARRLQSQYRKFILYVYGYCKSAGTLIAIGSDEIVMSNLAEFGPLDVQVSNGEEIGGYSSGLNVFEALSALRSQSFSFFEESLIRLNRKLGLSTKNSSPIATALTNGFLSPMLSQIDPVKLGELTRAIKIASKYGEELIKVRGNISERNLAKLVTDYPDHGYVIDIQEAKIIFKNIRNDNEIEKKLGSVLHDTIRYPIPGAQIVEKLYEGKSDDSVADKPTTPRRNSAKKARATGNVGENISEFKQVTITANS